jgi:hypothetical protein
MTNWQTNSPVQKSLPKVLKERSHKEEKNRFCFGNQAIPASSRAIASQKRAEGGGKTICAADVIVGL